MKWQCRKNGVPNGHETSNLCLRRVGWIINLDCVTLAIQGNRQTQFGRMYWRSIGRRNLFGKRKKAAACVECRIALARKRNAGIAAETVAGGAESRGVALIAGAAGGQGLAYR